jgi:hypothetical protein
MASRPAVNGGSFERAMARRTTSTSAFPLMTQRTVWIPAKMLEMGSHRRGLAMRPYRLLTFRTEKPSVTIWNVKAHRLDDFLESHRELDAYQTRFTPRHVTLLLYCLPTATPS